MAQSGAIPKSSRTFQSRNLGPGGSKTRLQVARSKDVVKEEKKEKVYENPPFSIALKRPPINPFLADKEKKKTIRRNAPPGEDLKQIKTILQSIRGNKSITATEFVRLIGPSTGDNGETLREVLQEDMISFKNLARRIYDTMTKDVSDVLTNQHIQVKEFHQERCTIYNEKMMRAINEIFYMDPEFDFERYFKHKEKYLAQRFPMPKLLASSSSEVEIHKRQMAYHRLNWLKAEGERLAAENTKLQQRLNELKKEQKQEMLFAKQREEEAELRREQLVAEETEAQNTLSKLSDNVEKTIIGTERHLRMNDDASKIKVQKKEEEARRTDRPRSRKKRPEWVSETAAEIDEAKMEETLGAEAHHYVPDEAVAAALTDKMRTRHKKTYVGGVPVQIVETPARPPPSAKETSPFHYSPPKSPVTSHYDRSRDTENQNLVTARVHTSTVVTEGRPQSTASSTQQRGRRNLQPRDTWGGFQ